MTQLIIPEHLKLMVSRPDGRLEVYDIPNGKHMVCEISVANGLEGVFPAGEVVMMSPTDSPDGQPHFIHISHLPDDVVIYNRETDTCRDKAGNTWTES